MMSDEVQLIQRIVQDLNNVRTQLQTARSQIGEITTTLEILADQPDEHAVYRAVGPLLLEVPDRDDLKASLASTLDALKEHSVKLDALEKQLVADYERISAQIESS